MEPERPSAASRWPAVLLRAFRRAVADPDSPARRRLLAAIMPAFLALLEDRLTDAAGRHVPVDEETHAAALEAWCEAVATWPGVAE